MEGSFRALDKTPLALGGGGGLVAELGLTLETPWTVAPPGSSVHGILQQCWSGLPFPSPGDLPDLGIEPGSPALQAVFCSAS